MRADDIIDQIDTCLTDYEISDDAMRCAPDMPRPPAIRPRANGSIVLVRRLIERHGLTETEARAAVLAAERGQDAEHARLAAVEASAVIAEVSAQFRAAFEPMIRRVADQMRQIKEAFQHLPEAVGCGDCGKPARRRDRPAWQSPYGPPRRRR